jgi:hypothetical protein
MTTITRTVMGSAIQTAQYFGKAHSILENSTLNEKFNIFQATLPNETEYHEASYIVIGDKGHTGTLASNNRFITKDVKHRRTDAALYNHIPFVIREIDNDLTIAERANYRLRVVSVRAEDNKTYVHYYAKRIDLSGSAVNVQKKNLETGETIPWIPTSANLNPVIPENFESTNEIISSSMVLPIEFTANDVDELRNVARIMYGSEDEALVSEFGIVSGVDRVLTGVSTGNQSINYTEVIAAQIVLHITSYYNASQHNDGFSLIIDGGVAEALDTMT